MAGVVLDNLCKQFAGGVTAVDRLSLEIADSEFVVLLGPSGCGKTTALQMIAGLEQQSSGRVIFGDRDVSRVPPDKRDVAMVFQSYALYPNMTVYDNIAFGLKMRRTPKRDIDRMVREAAQVIGLQDHLQRKPGQLSGGQRQRVALGRAMVRHPEVFLLDEPLSNVDAKLRAEMRINLKALHSRLGATFIYVTHDQVEAMSMADRIAVMNEGVLQQFDTPTAIYNRPASLFVASFIGSPQMNLVPGRLVGSVFASDSFSYSFREHGWPAGSDGTVVFGFRPTDVRVGVGQDAALSGTVEFLEPLGSDLVLSVRVGDQLLSARADPDFEVAVGERVGLEVAERRVHLFDSPSGARLDPGVRGVPEVPVPQPERVS